MPKQKAPVQVTGGGGFRYENSVSARFLLDLLGGSNSLGTMDNELLYAKIEALEGKRPLAPGGRDDEQGTLALLCLLLWSGDAAVLTILPFRQTRDDSSSDCLQLT
jgi:hypothetical protein